MPLYHFPAELEFCSAFDVLAVFLLILAFAFCVLWTGFLCFFRLCFCVVAFLGLAQLWDQPPSRRNEGSR